MRAVTVPASSDNSSFLSEISMKNRSYFDALDGLRGIAAFLVLYHHLESTSVSGTHYARIGFLAVDLFFILSGFVIAFSYEDALRKGLSFWAFTKRRLIRLYPLILLGIILTALVIGPSYQVAQSVVLNALFVPELWKQGNAYSVNAIQWTLFFELFANLLYAAAIPLLRSRTVAVLIGISAVALYMVGQSYGTLGLGWGTDNFAAGFPRVGFGFFTGVLLYRLWRWHGDRLPTLQLSGWVPVACFLAVILVPELLHFQTWRVQFLDVCLVFPILIWLGASASYGEVSGRVFSWLGRVSFPIYALQGPVRDIAEPAIRALPINVFVANLVLMGIVTLASWLALIWIDEPLRRYLSSRFISRRPALNPATAP